MGLEYTVVPVGSPFGQNHVVMAPLATRRLIVCADDFGISPGVNRGILEAHRDGIVTAASVMANLPSAAEALELGLQYPSLDLGVHLTLTAGRPRSSPSEVPTLVDGQGSFHHVGALALRLTLGLVARDQLKRELTEQIEWMLSHNVRLSHLDSHHHVHIHPRVRPVVLDLAHQFEVPFVRCPAELASPLRLLGLSPTNAARVATTDIVARSLRAAAAGTVQRTDAFRGIGLGLGFDTNALLRILPSLPPGLTELMTHPGYPDEELATHTMFTRGREREVGALTAPEAKLVLTRQGITLTSFREAAH